jgi:ferric-dicitrate binding protein FerR (iron transport regulator)
MKPSGRTQKVSRRQAADARDQLAAGGLSHQERRKLRSVAGARDLAVHRRHGQARHLLIVGAGAIAAMAVVAGALGLVPAIEAAGGQGRAGTFIVGSQVCVNRRGGCGWSGTFKSPDGVTVQHVTYDGTLPAYAGDGSSIPAIEPAGASHIVYPPHGSRAWIDDLVLMVLVGGVIGLLLWISPLGLGDHKPAGAVL